MACDPIYTVMKWFTHMSLMRGVIFTLALLLIFSVTLSAVIGHML